MTKFENPLPGVPNIESPFFEKIAESEQWDDETYKIGKNLRDNGYAVFDFPEPDFMAITDQIRSSLHDRYEWNWWRTAGWESNGGLRIQDAWTFDQNVRALASNAKVLKLLSQLYGREAFPFQTLNFPVGTQQSIHSDSTHFSSAPERFMCGVWLAFEDIDERNGALEYYPGSHKLPIYANEHIGVCASLAKEYAPYSKMEKLWLQLAEAHGLKKEIFRAKKGQALIWAANLLHGGSRHSDFSRTRWSQVTHYYFDDCSYFTPMTSDPMYGSISFREPINISTGKTQKNQYAGLEVDAAFINQTNPRPRDLPQDFDSALYYEANPDVRKAEMDAAQHYMKYGVFEGRRIRP